MNERDSEILSGVVEKLGFELADVIEDADLIIAPKYIKENRLKDIKC